MEREFGFGIVRQLFAPLLRSLARDEPRRLFAGPAALAAAIFGLGRADRRSRSAPPSPPSTGSSGCSPRWPRRGPLVLAIDDAHWADTASLRFIHYLGRRLDGLPVLLALAARPNEPGVAGGDAARADRRAPAVPTIRPRC